MAINKLSAKIAGEWIVIRWPSEAEGMAEWAEDDLQAEFVGATATSKWHYRLPADAEHVTKIVRLSPIPVDGDEAFNSLARGLKVDRTIGLKTSPGLPDPASIPQPALRKFDAWGHQLQAMDFLKRRRMWLALLAMAMGTGKTKAAIDSIINDAAIRTVLVLCPAKVLGVWRREVRVHGCDRIEVLVLDEGVGSVADKAEAAARFLERASVCARSPDPAVARKVFLIAVNYESARATTLANWLRVQLWDLTVLDESHRAKDPRGVTAKLIDGLRIVSKRRVCLTGTPMPHSPGDLWTQARFIDPTIFPNNYFAFLKRYAIRGWHKEVIGWRRIEELRAKFEQIAICIGEEVLDLPPLTIMDRMFEMSPSARRLYREVWDEMVGEIEGGGGLVVVSNVLVKLLRCQQIACGRVLVEDDAGAVIGIKTVDESRQEELAEILQDVDPREKVVVFCRFVEDLASVRRVVEAREWSLNGTQPGNAAKRAELEAAGQWQDYQCGEVSGRHSDLTADAKMPDHLSVLAVQVQSGGVGVDFTAASLAILYSVDFSAGNYEQMLKRLHRPGQSKPVRVVRLICAGTVDERIYGSIANKQDVVASIISEFGGKISSTSA